MKWYLFNQNNSGGYFTPPAQYLWIEAENENEAERIAEEVFGVYYFGVDAGLDCPCCGDRWDGCEEYDEPFFPILKDNEGYVDMKLLAPSEVHSVPLGGIFVGRGVVLDFPAHTNLIPDKVYYAVAMRKDGSVRAIAPLDEEQSKLVPEYKFAPEDIFVYEE